MGRMAGSMHASSTGLHALSPARMLMRERASSSINLAMMMSQTEAKKEGALMMYTMCSRSG